MTIVPDRANVFTSRTTAPTTLQAVTQIDRLTRQVSALIRLGRDELLDTTDGT
jgi:hypothetical protein